MGEEKNMSEEIRNLNDNEVEAVVGGAGGRKVNVPNVVGMTVMEAKMTLDMMSLNSAVNSSTSLNATVTRQDPAAGSSVNERTYVWIYAG